MAKAPANSIHPEDRAAWRAWLAEHHGRDEGVWLITYKKAAGQAKPKSKPAPAAKPGAGTTAEPSA